MNESEFLSWLKGFMEAIDGIPTQEQWDKIKEKAESTRKTKEVVDLFKSPGLPFREPCMPKPYWESPYISYTNKTVILKPLTFT